MITITVLGEKSNVLRQRILEEVTKTLSGDIFSEDQREFEIVEKFARKARKSKVIE